LFDVDFSAVVATKDQLIMVYKLLAGLQGLGIIGLTLLTTNTTKANPVEYVFSAPPEATQELVEIPTRETEYPFFECHSEAKNNQEEAAMDSHNCENLDNLTQDTEKNEQFTSQNEQTSNTLSK
jgi:hypothetical protein